jgi:MFS family permease
MRPEAARPRGAWRGRLPPALRRRDYALLWAAILVTGFGGQMVVVAVGWQVYAIHRDPFDLGLIGLAEFVPLALLALPAGQLADRVPRRLVLAVSLVLEVAVASLLLVVSLSGAEQLWPFLALAAAAGIAAAVGMPAGRALPATLVPLELVASAIALRSVAFQFAIIAGPALGGLLFAIKPEVVYGVAAGLLTIGLGCVLAMREPDRRPVDEAPTLQSVLAGIRFIRRTPVVLGSITLDLFAVLFGGAIALAPVFAQSILHRGPVGLGLLRSAPAVGALAAGLILAHRPLPWKAGKTLLVAVGLFGTSMIVFGLSRSFPLSLAALAASGFVDMVSMNIRGTTVAVVTPDELRGRVLAVEMVFISASNELGAFESGAAAALLGTVPSVVAGGVFTIGLALAWTRLFPALARVGRLEELRPAVP